LAICVTELTMAPADRELFLAEPHIGVLTIARPAGQPPLASPIWYEYVDGVVVINVGRGSVKARLATAAGVASLTVQTEQLPYRFVTVGGPVAVDEADDATRRRIAARYMPAGMLDEYLATGDAADMVTLRLSPTTWHSNDYTNVM
jgi:PPOX class probable F420-dependent enzyme